MKKIAAIATSLLFAAPVLAQSVGEKLKQAAISDMFEIQSSQLAAQRAKNEPTKAFASQMLTEHQKTSSELKSMVQSGAAEASIPSDLDSSHQKMLDKLKGLNGADFTKQYDKDQVSAQTPCPCLGGMRKAGTMPR